MALSLQAKIITAFVTLVLGIALMGSLATNTNTPTTLTTVTNEPISIVGARLTSGSINTSYTFTVANPPTGWKVLDCPLSSIVYGNSSTDYVLTTDYALTASTGVLTLVNSTRVFYGGNSTLVDYSYCADSYLNSSFGRSSLNLVPGFFAIALLLIGVGFTYSVLKDTGIINI